VSANKGTKRAVPGQRGPKNTSGSELVKSIEQALAYAKGENVAAPVTPVYVGCLQAGRRVKGTERCAQLFGERPGAPLSSNISATVLHLRP
jgi:hypothetical protein